MFHPGNMGRGTCSLIRVEGEGGVSGSFSSCLPPSTFWLVVVMSTMVSVRIVGSVPADFGVGEKEVATLTSRSLYWSPDTLHTKRNRVEQPIQLCGYRLLEAVRGLCRGNYVGYTRRSDPDIADDRMIVLGMQDFPSTDKARDSARYQLLSNKNEPGLSSINPSWSKQESRHFRFRRNIIDECCKKPCSVNEMLRYCGRR